jgi:hypothetical protein
MQASKFLNLTSSTTGPQHGERSKRRRTWRPRNSRTDRQLKKTTAILGTQYAGKLAGDLPGMFRALDLQGLADLKAIILAACSFLLCARMRFPCITEVFEQDLAPVDLSLAIGVAGELRRRERGSRGQCDHQRMVAHVARHETKSRSKLRESFFFGAKDVIFRATRLVGMENRIRRSAEEPPTMLPGNDRRHAPGARCQADPLDSASLCRSAASTPHW